MGNNKDPIQTNIIFLIKKQKQQTADWIWLRGYSWQSLILFHKTHISHQNKVNALMLTGLWTGWGVLLHVAQFGVSTKEAVTTWNIVLLWSSEDPKRVKEKTWNGCWTALIRLRIAKLWPYIAQGQAPYQQSRVYLPLGADESGSDSEMMMERAFRRWGWWHSF